jgi:hypothetical protein
MERVLVTNDISSPVPVTLVTPLVTNPKVLRLIISQADLDKPTYIIFENTFGVISGIFYAGLGLINIIFASAVVDNILSPQNKSMYALGNDNKSYYMIISKIDPSTISIQCNFLDTNSGDNNMLLNNVLEIYSYL